MRFARYPNARRGVFALIIVLVLLVGGAALTGTVIVAASRMHPAHFAAPLRIYPVTQQIPGECQAGMQGVVGQGSLGRTCFHVTTGVTIRQVTDIHVEREQSGRYEVSISLVPADSQAIARITRTAVGRNVAFTVGSHVVAVPYVEKPITKGKILISGGLTESAATSIVNQLKGENSAA